MEQLIDRGDMTSQQALAEIDKVYGSITKQLRMITQHEKLGGHHMLFPDGNGVGRRRRRPSDVSESNVVQ